MTTATRRIALIALFLACCSGAFAQEEAEAVPEPARLALTPEIETAPQFRLDIPSSWRTAQAEEKKVKPAGSTINGVRDNDYHYGVAPQALLALRMIFSDRASLDLIGREYFVSDVGKDTAGRGGHDNVARADAAFTVRVHKQHAVSVRW